MKQDNNHSTPCDETSHEATEAAMPTGDGYQRSEQSSTKPLGQEPPEQEEQSREVDTVLERLGVSPSIATSARAIIGSLKSGTPPGEDVVKLIVAALSHDEDVKNAEAQGYLRGRNEVIEASSKLDDPQEPQPVNFPIYRKRSFWD